MLNLSDILSIVTLIFFIAELYSFDEFTEHVNTVPFNVLSTDCSVRVFTDTRADDISVLIVHSAVISLFSRPGTVQVIVNVVPTVKSVCCPDMVISVKN